MSWTKRTLGAAVAAGTLVALSALPASAGLDLQGGMVATPNPATVGDTVTISNLPGDDNTCLYFIDYETDAELLASPSLVLANMAVVQLDITAPDATELPTVEVTPDQDGNWSYELAADQVGTYLVDGYCLSGIRPTAEVAAEGPFMYNPLDIVVAQEPEPTTTTSMETADTSGAPPTTAASAVPAAPRYTG